MADSNQNGIPRIVYLKRILQLCFYPVFTVAVGNIVILFVAQARETLFAFDEDRLLSRQALAFMVAFLLWMLSAWYVARLLVGKVFVPNLIGTCVSRTFSIGVSKHLPRYLALAAGLPMAVSLAIEGEPRGLGIGLCIVSIAVFVLLVFRRDIGRKLGRRWVNEWAPSENFQSFATLDRIGLGIVLGSLAASFFLFFAIFFGMEEVTRRIGSPALVLFALASWTVFGGFALTYWPKAHGVFAMTWLPIVLALISAPFNDNHPVAPGSSMSPNASKMPPRKALSESFTQWMQRRPDRSAPIIFVAAAGGASRAAYWTTSALGQMEDEARHGSMKFADNIFMISGISGGSVGAVAFLTALDAVRSVDGATSNCRSVRDVANDFTGRDHLSAVVGFMLYADFVQRFIPYPIAAFDRSRALEEVWVRDWTRTLQDKGCSGVTNAWEQPFLSLFARQGGNLPRLALNTTALSHGWPVMQAGFTLENPTAFDLLSTNLATDRLTLAQAAHNSARFPYISPAGVVRLQADGRIWDHVGDGGYIEASGTLVLGEILQELIRDDLICMQRDEAICPPDVARRSQLRILILDNQPTAETVTAATAEDQDRTEDREIVGSWLCSTGNGSTPGAGREEKPHNRIIAERGSMPWPDVGAPVIGAFATRAGRAVSSEIDLLRLVGDCEGTQFAELRLPIPRNSSEREPSMNWMLNRESRRQMTERLSQPASGTELAENLAIVRSWMSP